jgi:hypothetical protein
MKLKYTVKIVRVADGAEALCHEECDPEYRDTQQFVWSEGNNGCDCNRAAWFARARGEETAHPVDLPCGDSAFYVDKIVWEDGTEERVDRPERAPKP